MPYAQDAWLHSESNQFLSHCLSHQFCLCLNKEAPLISQLGHLLSSPGERSWHEWNSEWFGSSSTGLKETKLKVTVVTHYTLESDLTSLRTSSSVISELRRILPQSSLTCSAPRALPLGIGSTLLLPWAPYPWGKQTIVLSHVTRRGAFSFPFFCEKGRGLLLSSLVDAKFGKTVLVDWSGC